ALNPSIGRKLNMIIRLPFSKILRKRLRVLKYNGQMVKSFFGNDLHNKEKVLEHFAEYNKRVLAAIPPEKILIYDVKSGWEPLCNFLGVPVPVIPFPKSNTKDEFIYNVRNMLGQDKISL
ncbi:MAG: sulfotransferase, partial [Saprospiraceae bacterium]